MREDWLLLNALIICSQYYIKAFKHLLWIFFINISAYFRQKGSFKRILFLCLIFLNCCCILLQKFTNLFLIISHIIFMSFSKRNISFHRKINIPHFFFLLVWFLNIAKALSIFLFWDLKEIHFFYKVIQFFHTHTIHCANNNRKNINDKFKCFSYISFHYFYVFQFWSITKTNYLFIGSCFIITEWEIFREILLHTFLQQ